METPTVRAKSLKEMSYRRFKKFRDNLIEVSGAELLVVHHFNEQLDEEIDELFELIVEREYPFRVGKRNSESWKEAFERHQKKKRTPEELARRDGNTLGYSSRIEKRVEKRRTKEMEKGIEQSDAQIRRDLRAEDQRVKTMIEDLKKEMELEKPAAVPKQFRKRKTLDQPANLYGRSHRTHLPPRLF